MSIIWVEKYRPKEFSDVVGLPSEIPTLLSNLPHLLFIGRPGTGKTTTAKIIINKLQAETLTLNASDERGIDVIRNKIKSFAMTKSNKEIHKIVFLDEMDALTGDAQNSMRNLMETYHSNVRFICTANYENKIIDALKSRLTTFKFEVSEIGELINYLRHICVEERFELLPNFINEVINKNHGDIRKCVNQLQRLHSLNRPITMSDLNQESAMASTIL